MDTQSIRTDRPEVIPKSTREERGLDLYRARHGEFVRVSKSVVSVPSCSERGAYYAVDTSAGRCTCEDYRRHADLEGFGCKHLVAARLYRAWMHKTARTIAPLLADAEVR